LKPEHLIHPLMAYVCYDIIPYQFNVAIELYQHINACSLCRNNINIKTNTTYFALAYNIIGS
jgi:hypothetical protein